MTQQFTDGIRAAAVQSRAMMSHVNIITTDSIDFKTFMGI